MWNVILSIFKLVFSLLKPFAIGLAVLLGVFYLLCGFWCLIYRFKYKMPFPHSGQVPQKRAPIWKQILIDVPRRYVLDRFQRDPDMFIPHGIHMFCGEQGSGKTIACVELVLRLQKQFPKSKLITNFDVATQDDELRVWQQLITYNNGIYGVIAVIDEIQNWFQSGKNQLPEQMLEVVTQNRKNRRIIPCTAQVYTRVSKALREQVTLLYHPHTFCGCFTVVIIRKPILDNEGNVIKLKYRGMYCFTHTEELRNAYDTYKVIHTLAKEGFKDPAPQPVTNVYIQDAKRK